MLFVPVNKTKILNEIQHIITNSEVTPSNIKLLEDKGINVTVGGNKYQLIRTSLRGTKQSLIRQVANLPGGDCFVPYNDVYVSS